MPCSIRLYDLYNRTSIIAKVKGKMRCKKCNQKIQKHVLRSSSRKGELAVVISLTPGRKW